MRAGQQHLHLRACLAFASVGRGTTFATMHPPAGSQGHGKPHLLSLQRFGMQMSSPGGQEVQRGGVHLKGYQGLG